MTTSKRRFLPDFTATARAPQCLLAIVGPRPFLDRNHDERRGHEPGTVIAKDGYVLPAGARHAGDTSTSHRASGCQ